MSALGSILYACFVVIVVVGSCVGAGGTFGQRCGKLYEGAAFERCVIRMKDGGPLYEENLGYTPNPPAIGEGL